MKILCEKGSPIISEHRYPIDENTVLKRGQVVKLVSGLVVTAVAGENSQVLGICLEDHPQGAGATVNVADGPTLLMSCPAPTVTVSESTASTITDSSLAAFANDIFNNGKLVLVSKAEDSTNSGSIGEVYNIADYDGNGKCFTLSSPPAGKPSAGDTYMIFPPFGKSLGNLVDGCSHTLSATTSSFSLRVVGWDIPNGNIHFITNKHFYGNIS